MEMLGFSAMHFYKSLKISFPRRAAVFEYYFPVTPDNLIDLNTEGKGVGKTSFTIGYTFFKKNREGD